MGPIPPLRRTTPAAARGFTLVEVLVALLVMAILAALAWRGLDGMIRARDTTGASMNRTLKLNTAVVQWEQDLGAMVSLPVLREPFRFNGQSFVFTRRVPEGVALVVWAVRDGRWQRWVSPPMTRVGEVQENWLRAQGLLGNERGTVTAAEGASEWQLYKWIAGSRTNMQSSGDLALAPASAASAAIAAAGEALPDAVEMVLTLDGQPITRLIAIGPGRGGNTP